MHERLYTETKAPFNYTKLDDDIIFRISAMGVPSLISDSYHGLLVETDDSYIYTLSVPNVREDDTLEFLTIEKKVGGSFGNRSKEFSFTVAVEGFGGSEGYIWAKNGEGQTEMPKNGCKFTMKHNDRVEIALPKKVSVTVSEKNEGYSSSFRLGSEAAEETDNVSFVFSGETHLLVTNTLDGDINTGLAGTLGRSLVLVMLPMVPVRIIFYYKRRKRSAA